MVPRLSTSSRLSLPTSQVAAPDGAIVPVMPELPTRTAASPVSTARARACQACCSASTESENQLSLVMKTNISAPIAASFLICAESVSSKQIATASLTSLPFARLSVNSFNSPGVQLPTGANFCKAVIHLSPGINSPNGTRCTLS